MISPDYYNEPLEDEFEDDNRGYTDWYTIILLFKDTPKPRKFRNCVILENSDTLLHFRTLDGFAHEVNLNTVKMISMKRTDTTLTISITNKQ